MTRDLLFALDFLYKDFLSQLSTLSAFSAVLLCTHSLKFDVLLMSSAGHSVLWRLNASLFQTCPCCHITQACGSLHVNWSLKTVSWFSAPNVIMITLGNGSMRSHVVALKVKFS